jgi:uncharacterized protein (DUF983 family)
MDNYRRYYYMSCPNCGGNMIYNHLHDCEICNCCGYSNQTKSEIEEAKYIG